MVGYERYLRQYRNSEMQKSGYIQRHYLRKNYKKVWWLMEEKKMQYSEGED
jgi:hypothetical protein